LLRRTSCLRRRVGLPRPRGVHGVWPTDPVVRCARSSLRAVSHGKTTGRRRAAARLQCAHARQVAGVHDARARVQRHNRLLHLRLLPSVVEKHVRGASPNSTLIAESSAQPVERGTAPARLPAWSADKPGTTRRNHAALLLVAAMAAFLMCALAIPTTFSGARYQPGGAGGLRHSSIALRRAPRWAAHRSVRRVGDSGWHRRRRVRARCGRDRHGSPGTGSGRGVVVGVLRLGRRARRGQPHRCVAERSCPNGIPGVADRSAAAVIAVATVLLGVWASGLAELVGLVITLVAILAAEARWRARGTFVAAS
jgi:hypothetical protein